MLRHVGGPAPKADLSLIEAVIGLKVVSRTDSALLVTGPKDLASLQEALPGLQGWSFVNENFARTMS